MAKKDKKHGKASSKGSAAVVATLHRQQANALVAYLNYKKYHWLSYGPLFRDIHLMLDEQATPVVRHDRRVRRAGAHDRRRAARATRPTTSRPRRVKPSKGNALARTR